MRANIYTHIFIPTDIIIWFGKKFPGSEVRDTNFIILRRRRKNINKMRYSTMLSSSKS